MVAPDVNGTPKEDEDKEVDEVKNGYGHDADIPDLDKYDVDSEKDSRSDDSDSTGGVLLTPRDAAQETVDAIHDTSSDESATSTPRAFGPARKYPTFSIPASSQSASRLPVVPYSATWPHASLRSLSWPPASPASVDRLSASPAVQKLLASLAKADEVEDKPAEIQEVKEVQEVQDKKSATKEKASASPSSTNRLIASRTKRLPREPERPRHVRFATPPSDGRPDKIKLPGTEDKPAEKSQEVQERSNGPPPTPNPPPPTPNPPPPTRPPPLPPPNGHLVPRFRRRSQIHPMAYLYLAILELLKFNLRRALKALFLAILLLVLYLVLFPFRFAYWVLRLAYWLCACVMALIAGVVMGIVLAIVSIEKAVDIRFDGLRGWLCDALMSQKSDE